MDDLIQLLTFGPVLVKGHGPEETPFVHLGLDAAPGEAIMLSHPHAVGIYGEDFFTVRVDTAWGTEAAHGNSVAAALHAALEQVKASQPG